jgi:hypothetical protein
MRLSIDELRTSLRRRVSGPAPDPAAVLAALAVPRMTGSAGAQRTRELVAARLEGLGFAVQRRAFGFSVLPGRFGLSIAGGIVVAGSAGGALLLLRERPLAAGVCLAAAVTLLVTIAVLWPAAIRRAPWLRREGVNLLAHAPGGVPRWILVAHLDTKSQFVPLLLRAPAVAVAMLSLATLLGASVLGGAPAGMALAAGAAGVAAGAVLVASWAGDASPGALDNASGVATLLGVAAQEAGATDVGFLVTDAEELGLAGARAAADWLPRLRGAINLDGIDDRGGFYAFERFGLPPRYAAPNLAMALLAAGEALGEPVRRRATPLGLLLDHMPLARAGVPALTLARGSVGSLARVHRPADGPGRLRGTGVARAVRLVTAALQALRMTLPPAEGGAARGAELD